ncbi:hypothetical protein Agub_g9679 [Astrephomene gubernaculifera]|uniref:Uncharacterized protein n=1 Tax=Astrephomene gubernaculifera TaxID=47775 RepID=A0AAD3HPG6_9CHLO|nr:hypothetical protein Agub_g9679 [Astrephomene gubernaculifera]
MAKVLGFWRRKAPEKSEALAPVPAPSSPQLPPSTKSASAAAEDRAGDQSIDLVPTRRQASQINVNRFLANSPYGLTAILKKSSRPDVADAPATPTPGDAPPTAASPSPPPMQPVAPPGEAPPSRPMRERRKSTTLTEMAQAVQNLDVSHAALIMMPARLRQELSQPNAELSGTAQPSSGQLPQLSRASALPATPLSPSSAGGGGSTGDGAAAAAGSYLPSSMGPGGAPGRSLDRTPSIIREAVKQQQLLRPPPQPADSQLRSYMSSLGHADTGAGGWSVVPAADRAPAAARSGTPLERRTSTLTQAPQANQASTLGGPSRHALAAMPSGKATPGVGSQGQAAAAGTSGGTLPGPGPQPAVQGSKRRSDPGEDFRMRAAAASAMAPAAAADAARGSNNRNGTDEGLGPGSGSRPSYLYGTGRGSDKDLRRGMMGVSRTETALDDGMRRPGSFTGGPGAAAGAAAAGGGADVKLPNIGLAGARRGTTAAAGREGDAKDRSAVDVAALSEAIATYESEAARLRAAALRKMDTRIKRHVMERFLGREDDDGPSPSGDSGSGGSGSMARPTNPLAPRLLGRNRLDGASAGATAGDRGGNAGGAPPPASALRSGAAGAYASGADVRGGTRGQAATLAAAGGGGAGGGGAPMGRLRPLESMPALDR